MEAAGVYTLGVGDAMASVVGVALGRTPWGGVLGWGVGGGGKTVEGTVGGVVAVIIVHAVVRWAGIGVREEEGIWVGGAIWRWLAWVGATVAMGLMEAWTLQIDNLVLPLYYYTAWNIARADPRSGHTLMWKGTG